MSFILPRAIWFGTRAVVLLKKFLSFWNVFSYLVREPRAFSSAFFFCRYHLIIWFWFFDWATGFIFFFCYWILCALEFESWNNFIPFSFERFSFCFCDHVFRHLADNFRFSCQCFISPSLDVRMQPNISSLIGGFFVCQIDRWPSKTACWFLCFFFPDSLFDLEDFDFEPFSFFFFKLVSRIFCSGILSQ